MATNISVVIPAYNAEKYISSAINSVLIQNIPSIEIIVVDDGSTDKTGEIVAKYGERIRYVYQNNAGPAKARNTGIKISNGQFISFLDADDIWPKNKIAVQQLYFDKHPKIDILFGLVEYIDKNGRNMDTPAGKQIINLVLGCGLYKKLVFEKVGYFDESLQLGEDLDWFLRSKEKGINLDIIEETTLYYRRHDNNITNNIALNRIAILRVLRKSLNRRRQHGLKPETAIPLFTDIDKLKEYWSQ